MPEFRAPVANFKVRVPEAAYDKVMVAMLSAVAAMTDGGDCDPETEERLAKALLQDILAQMRCVHNYRKENDRPLPVAWDEVSPEYRAQYRDMYSQLFRQTYSGVAIAYGAQYISTQPWLVVLNAEHWPRGK